MTTRREAIVITAVVAFGCGVLLTLWATDREAERRVCFERVYVESK